VLQIKLKWFKVIVNLIVLLAQEIVKHAATPIRWLFVHSVKITIRLIQQEHNAFLGKVAHHRNIDLFRVLEPKNVKVAQLDVMPAYII